MSTPAQLPSQSLSKTIKDLLSDVNVKKRFNQLLGENAPSFITSILQVVNSNDLLKNADPTTILTAAATAAVLKLPINQNLGFSYIVPYNKSVRNGTGGWDKVQQAQFILGAKGLLQLAQRTGQYKNINVLPVYENQFTSFNHLTEELIGDFTKEGEGDLVGFVSYFKTIAGFEKTVYWSKKKMDEHGAKFSKRFTQENGSWQKHYIAMGCKTLIKNMLSKYGILSIELNIAIRADQSVQTKEGEYSYPDNEPLPVMTAAEVDDEKEKQRMLEFINASETVEQLTQVHGDAYDKDLGEEYDAKYILLTEGKKGKND